MNLLLKTLLKRERAYQQDLILQHGNILLDLKQAIDELNRRDMSDEDIEELEAGQVGPR